MFTARFFNLLITGFTGNSFVSGRTHVQTLRRPLFVVFLIVLVSAFTPILAQNSRSGYSSNFAGKKAFRQEIARVEITVEREGEIPLPISLVPRVQKGDLLRVRLLDEPINGIRPSESRWNWTFLVAYVNPSRNELDEETVSREILFKRDGWYREHLFKVPYNSQPIFFLYPKPKYRKKIKKLLSKNFSEIKKIGEKTLEIADAYAQIGIFLNELQSVINENPNRAYSPYNYGSNNRFGDDFIQQQLVERLAQSFNIALPSCWKNGGGNFYASNDFITRARCVAKNVRLEDFDLSVNRILQQGGLIAATKLVEKYPQLAYWINIAAAAADIILKILKKTPLKIVPTLVQAKKNNRYNRNTSRSNSRQTQSILPPTQKISVYAEQPPTEGGFVTAFPIVLHKWQESPDPEVISLTTPGLLEPCLHSGQNILRNKDIAYDWLRDPFARNFRLIMRAENGFEREFQLTKNVGISGWMLALKPQDMKAFPKTRMNLEARIVATRGFNQIESEKFTVPISAGGKWEMGKESQKSFSVGGKRRIVIRNTMGSCRCLQSVKYMPSTGGEFTFTTKSDSNPLRFNENGTEAWFEIDTSYFQPGQGKLLLRTYGSQRPQNLNIKLFPKMPKITKLIAHRGDNTVIIEGERIEQIKALRINGKPASLIKPKGNRSRQHQNQRNFVFQNPNNKVLSNKISFEMKLDGDRRFRYPHFFSVLPARPAIEANKQYEISAVVLDSGTNSGLNKFDLSEYPVVSIETGAMTLVAKTTLADYAFKAENLTIETKIENGRIGQNSLPQPTFEVLDSLTLQIGFTFTKQSQRYLGGRRLQFRIKDAERGYSRWYTIKQTFIRIPQIESIVCRKDVCKLTGKGLKYIGQISTDGGSTWRASGQIQPTPNRKSFMLIQGAKNRILLRIKLRDFPNTEGLPIGK